MTVHIVTFLNGGYKVWERWFVNRYKGVQKCENKTLVSIFKLIKYITLSVERGPP